MQQTLYTVKHWEGSSRFSNIDFEYNLRSARNFKNPPYFFPKSSSPSSSPKDLGSKYKKNSIPTLEIFICELNQLYGIYI